MMNLHRRERRRRNRVKVTMLVRSWPPNMKFSFSPYGKDSAVCSPNCIHSIPEQTRKSHFPPGALASSWDPKTSSGQ